jgi:hypothetical protein
LINHTRPAKLNPYPPRGEPTMKRPPWSAIIAIAFLAAFVSLAVVTYRAVSRSIDAETTHQAYTRTLQALTAYVHDVGRWPSSWNELAEIDLKRPDGGDLGSHEYLKKVESRVHIDFKLMLNEIADMTPENFSAVTAVFPNYGPDEPGIVRLLQTIRTSQLDSR